MVCLGVTSGDDNKPSHFGKNQVLRRLVLPERAGFVSRQRYDAVHQGPTAPPPNRHRRSLAWIRTR